MAGRKAWGFWDDRYRVRVVRGVGGRGALPPLAFRAVAEGQTQVSLVDSRMKNSKLQPVPAQNPGVPVEIR